ncbi:MAG: hypothetical protein B6I19_09135 [Bacteroidetes bacterium 4572_114]|nr:MAG: hypothetical protein B6I19_09135 [Bacteroidetes bacterium 4572_114]
MQAAYPEMGSLFFIYFRFIYFWAAKPGFPFVVVSCRLVFVGGAWASFLSLRPPTKSTAGISTSYHFNPCRSTTNSLSDLKSLRE